MNNPDLIAVIVLYKTKINESKSFICLLKSIEYSKVSVDIVIYDNSPDFNLDTDIVLLNNPIRYIADGSNGGVSKAYNAAFEIAKEKNKGWLLLLDQDTEFPIETINRYFDGIKKYPEESLFVPLILSIDNNKIISPCIFKFMRGFYAKEIFYGKNSLVGHSVINCGICISVNAFGSINGYNENIRLDFSDFEFIERFKKVVSKNVIVVELKFYHSLSAIQKQNISQEKVRFRYYLAGGRHLSKNSFESFFIFINAFLRALKLTIIYKSFFFIKEMLIGTLR